MQEEFLKLKRESILIQKNVSELEIITMKYPNAIITLHSAFYYYSLTDVIPDVYSLATDRNAAKIHDARIKQYFYPKESFEIGKTKMNYQGTEITIYNLERLLIELIKNKKNLSFDFYKEIILNYRNRVCEMDIEKVQDYTYFLPKGEKIVETIQLEVF